MTANIMSHACSVAEKSGDLSGLGKVTIWGCPERCKPNVIRHYLVGRKPQKEVPCTVMQWVILRTVIKNDTNLPPSC